MAYQRGAKMGSLWYSTGRGAAPTYHWPAPVSGETKDSPPESHAATTEPNRHAPATAAPSPCAPLPSAVEKPVKLPVPHFRPAEVPASDEKELFDLVRRLGGASDPDPIASMSLWHLRAAPRAAVRRLVAELKVVAPDRNDDDDARHVIWCIRALRLITGHDFRFDTATPLSANQCRLYGTCYGQIPFFIESTASAPMTVAPADVQQKIVAAWKIWFVEHGGTFVPE
jgi:hypothetical protein